MILFDNLLITDDPSVAAAYAADSFDLKRKKLDLSAVSISQGSLDFFCSEVLYIFLLFWGYKSNQDTLDYIQFPFRSIANLEGILEVISPLLVAVQFQIHNYFPS